MYQSKGKNKIKYMLSRVDELIHSNHLEQHYADRDNKLGLFVAG